MRQTEARTALRTWLAANNSTQVELASELGISDALLSKVLSGYRTPSKMLRDEILRRTGVDLGDYMEVAS